MLSGSPYEMGLAPGTTYVLYRMYPGDGPYATLRPGARRRVVTVHRRRPSPYDYAGQMTVIEGRVAVVFVHRQLRKRYVAVVPAPTTVANSQPEVGMDAAGDSRRGQLCLPVEAVK